MQVIKLPIERVLLIDDDEDDCLVFRLALAEVDPTIQFEYRNGCEQAADALATFRPNLLFLDINLPRINGIECLRHLQQHTDKTVPVVMYSSSELPRDLKEAYDSGATLYFRKPAVITELIESLRGIFNMAWHAPGTIRDQYRKDGRYLPF